MVQNKSQSSNAMEQASEAKETSVQEKSEEEKKSESAKKIDTYLITIPTAVKKFAVMPDKKNAVPEHNDSPEEPFGVGPLVFPCLQRFNNVKSFLPLFMLAIIPHGMVFALADLSFKVYVFQFSVSNTQAFLMDSTDYFAAFVISLFIAYFSHRGNRVKWVAAGSFVTGLASLVFALPYFNYEIVKVGAIKEDLCLEGKKTTKICGENVLPHKSACIYIFIFGQFLHGIAGMPIYMLGVTFLFDHIPTRLSGSYLAIADSALVVGYTMGFLLGVNNFKFPVEEAKKAVGHVQRFRTLQRGWLRSHLFVALFAFCASLPLLCFPASLPGAHKIRLQKSQEPPTIDRRLKDKKIEPNLRSFLYAIWCILRNPLVLTQTFCKVIETMSFKSSTYFLPKFLSTQFLMTPTFASLVTGMFMLPGSLLGRLAGGCVVDRLEMSCKGKLKFIVVTSFISVGLFLLTFFVNCETVKFAGINNDYDSLGIIGNLTAPCNENCGCKTSLYDAVCGRDDIQYFTPCFAGCKTTKTLKNEKMYYNCSCIKEGLTTADNDGHFIDAISGTCNTRCLSLPLFYAFYFSATLFSSLPSIPILLILLQSVPASWNSVTMGVTFTIWRIFGVIPGPLITSSTEDFICTYWDINECGEKVRCWIYHKTRLIYTFKSIWVSLKLGICLLCLYAICRHDYVVKGETKSLATPVEAEKAKRKEKS